MYKYEFNEADAMRFAQSNGYEAFRSGNELIFRKCPYCGALTHDKNKFSINLTTGMFQCFRASCNAHGNMLTLAKDFNFSLGREWDDYYKLPSMQVYKKLAQPKAPIEPKNFAIEYMKSRGIGEDVVKKYQITTRKDMPTVLAMPFFDETGRLTFIKYRLTDPEEVKKFGGKEFTEKGCKAILYGMNCCNIENHTLIITEGQIDSLSLAEAGIENAVSVPTGAKGFTWLPHCWKWIKKNFTELIVFGDFEKGKISLLEELTERLGSSIGIRHVREEDYKGCKDANDILLKYGREQLHTCVNNAVYSENRALIDISEVEKIDLSRIEKIRTGLAEIDSLIGGIALGGLTVINGKSGEGKSTLASQILAMAIDEGYKCMAYSGELPNGIFKEWLYLQIAGKEHIHINGNDDAKIDAEAEARINQWMHEKLFLYDIDKMYEKTDEEFPALIETVEQAILQYECKVILLDNLMTALDLFEAPETVMINKYEAQAKFVRTLAGMARKHKVAIILVAHRRKGGSYSYDVNDEISGSSDITNYAAMIIGYAKYTEVEIMKGEGTAEQRKISVTKERYRGRTVYNQKLTFDKASKRILSIASNYMAGYRFKWMTETAGSYTDDGFRQIDMTDAVAPFE